MEDDFKDVCSYSVRQIGCSGRTALTSFCSLQAVDIIPGRYAVCFLRHPDGEKFSKIAASGISYCIDDELVSSSELQEQMPPAAACPALGPCLTRSCLLLQLYEPFYADFGPLNLGKTYRFCEHTKQLLQVRPLVDMFSAVLAVIGWVQC